MAHTLEARWFASPPLPPALRDGFDALGLVKTRSQTDLYLPTEDASLNVKLRDGHVQIKRRLSGPFQKALAPHATGNLEHWTKWSFPLATERAALWDDDPTDLWVPVQKTRHQLAVPPSEQTALADTLPTAPPATLNAEVTTVEAGPDKAWTLCVEAEGPTPSLSDTLLAAAPRLLDGLSSVSLSPDQSYGYARWLQQRPGANPRPAPTVRISDL